MNILKVVFVIIGTLIGAGFASGQEIYVFFYSFGIKGIYGIIISSSIIGLTIYSSFRIIKEHNIDNYKDFLDKTIKNKKIKDIINIIVNIFILISFYIMIAGFGAYLKQEYNINNIIGSGILASICLIIFKTNKNALVKVNEILIPILIFIIVLIGIVNVQNIEFSNLKNYLIPQNNNNWLIMSIMYASYNCILLVPVLITIKNNVKKAKDIKYISLIVTIIVTLLLVIIFFLLLNIDIDIKSLEMPAVYAINKISHNIKNIYGITILISIFTTAISLGISFLNNTSKNRKKHNTIALIICLTSIMFSTIGFSNLVNLLYPILGFLGIIQIIQIYKKAQDSSKYIAKTIKN